MNLKVRFKNPEQQFFRWRVKNYLEGFTSLGKFLFDFFGNSDISLNQAQVFSLKLTPSLTLILTLKIKLSRHG